MTVKHDYNLNAKTIEFDKSFELQADIHIQDITVDRKGFDSLTILNLQNNDGREINIRIDWCHFSAADRALTTLIVDETNYLFFGARFFWGIIDLDYLEILRQERCMQFWSFDRLSDKIILTTELEALALNLKGETIDTAPIDPPFDRKDFEDRIEYKSPVFGKQTLKFNKRFTQRAPLILSILIIILLFNCFLVYGLLYGPYFLYFDRTEFSATNFNTRQDYASIATLLNILLLLASTIWLIFKYLAMKRFAFIAPIISILTFLLISHVQTYYPDLGSEYTQDGYEFKIERWYNNGEDIYKRWKSEQPFEYYHNDPYKVVWKLDSISKK